MVLLRFVNVLGFTVSLLNNTLGKTEAPYVGAYTIWHMSRKLSSLAYTVRRMT